jgi:hypothetical protein
MSAEEVSGDYLVSRPIKQSIGPTKTTEKPFSCGKCGATKGSATAERTKAGFKDYIVVSLMMAKPGPKNTIVKAKSSHLKLDLQITLEDRLYDLMGVTLHFGANLNEGHYVALVRIKNTWFQASDTELKVVSKEFVYGLGKTKKRRGDPTMLFYRIASSIKRKEDVHDALEEESPVKGSPWKKHKPTVVKAVKNSAVTIQEETKKTPGRDKKPANDKYKKNNN